VVKDNDSIFADDMIDWSNSLFPRRGDLVFAHASPLLFPGMSNGDRFFGVVIDLGVEWMSANDPSVAHPVWKVLWSNTKMQNYLPEIGEEWFACGYVERVI
tara:strand:- start:74 stop:376 length:303 start_codon:yes stop_codon:yes gene_type:complete